MAEKDSDISESIKSKIRDVPDFPREGIIFKDITTVLRDPQAFKKSVDLLAKHYEKQNIDYIKYCESYDQPVYSCLWQGKINPHKKFITYSPIGN